AGVVVACVVWDARATRPAKFHPPLETRPPMNPREVSSLSNVRSELIDFAVDRDVVDIGAGVIDQRQPIFFARRHNFAVAKSIELNASVEGSLKYRGARPRHRRVTLWI